MTLIDPTADDLESLTSLAGGAVRAGDDAAPYLAEPRDQVIGRAALVLRPGTVEEVSRIVRHCAERRIGIVPHGGGTGLVGGQVSPDGPLPVVVSLDRMDRIRAVHADENVLIAEAGCILEDVQKAAEAAGQDGARRCRDARIEPPIQAAFLRSGKLCAACRDKELGIRKSSQESVEAKEPEG